MGGKSSIQSIQAQPKFRSMPEYPRMDDQGMLMKQPLYREDPGMLMKQPLYREDPGMLMKQPLYKPLETPAFRTTPPSVR